MESQLPRTEFISNDDSDLEENKDISYGDEQFGPISSNSRKTSAVYQCDGPEKYLIHHDDVDNSDQCAIAKWMNNYVVH